MSYNDFISTLHELNFLDSVAKTFPEKLSRFEFYMNTANKYFFSKDKREQALFSFCFQRAVSCIVD